MRICYLVLVHHKFPQAVRLIRRLADGSSGFVIHIDAGADRAGVELFRSEVARFRPLYTPRVRVRWGSYSQARAIMACVQTAAAASSYDRYCLISGQDYPIASKETIAAFFARNRELEYLEAYPQDLSDGRAPGWSPYHRFRRYHAWLGHHHRPLPWLRHGLPPLPIRHGSTWWALSRAALEYVSAQFVANGALRRYLRFGFLVDEVYIPTILNSSPFASRIAGTNVTFACWTPTSGPHPCVLSCEHLPELLASDKLFARKFDTQLDERVLDRLDELQAGAPEPRVASRAAAGGRRPTLS